MNSANQDHLSVARALFQLQFYLDAVGVPITVKELYRRAYQEKRGAFYRDEWLDHLRDDPRVASCTEESFTTHTIAETLVRTGHEPILRQLIKVIREQNIGFLQAYIVGSKRP